MSNDKTKPILNVNFLSHATLEVFELVKSIGFYQRFLGLNFFSRIRYQA